MASSKSFAFADQSPTRCTGKHGLTISQSATHERVMQGTFILAGLAQACSRAHATYGIKSCQSVPPQSHTQVAMYVHSKGMQLLFSLLQAGGSDVTGT